MGMRTPRIPDCHPERAHNARGMCKKCYQDWYTENLRGAPGEYSANYRKPPHLPKRNADCHPDQEHWAKGLCGPCYHKQRTNRVRATCHPHLPHLAEGLCAACYRKRRYDDDPEIVRAQVRESQAKIRERIRRELVEAYGGKCACPKCPETNVAFLCLDHINGDGKAHRMKVGSHTYADLRRRSFPQEGFRLLCWNCNSATRFGRTCPHMEEG